MKFDVQMKIWRIWHDKSFEACIILHALSKSWLLNELLYDLK